MTFTEHILSLPDDYEGKVTATLIRSGSVLPGKRAVLYLHGYIDYFFQTHMAERFVAEGWTFYALDLRKYGRSLLPHQHAFYCRSLKEYFPEIDMALSSIRQDGNRDITLLGHSTGGLIAALYAAQGNCREAVDRLVLNSPFLEFNVGWLKRRIGIPIVACLSRVLPYAYKRNELSPYYYTSVHRSMKGEWDFDPALKPQQGVPLYFAWLAAIRRGQQQLKKGLHIAVPVLVLHSDRSSKDKRWSDAYTRTDTVLNVEDIRLYAPKLGSNVTDVAIEGGLHDLALSKREVREHFFEVMIAWMNNRTIEK